MLISELAERTGLTVHTIRFYEKLGLLDGEHAHRAANNYRQYSEEAVNRLLLIKRGQAAGFTLTEIRDLMGLWEAGKLTREDKEAIIRDKLAAIEAKMRDLEGMRAYLLAKLPLLDVTNEELVAQTPLPHVTR
jgi:DNA-binding transcriptional MerR regulator